MDQRFEGLPKAEIRAEGRKLFRSVVVNDWGSQLLWEVRRNGDVVATVPARQADTYELAETTPGQYEVVLQMFQYEGYEKDPSGKFTKIKFVEVSNKVSVTVG